MQGLSIRLAQTAPIPLDVTLSCRPGELLALVGPSGSGKSTILRTIAGLYRPRREHVSCDGAIWADSDSRRFVPTRLRRIGLVSQSYALFPHLTARQNVMAALRDLAQGSAAVRADELLALVNLKGLEQRRPAELSGGQQQRVAVARALARDPSILLLDEPFSAVDKVTRGRLYQELASIRSQLAMPIVLVTHDLDEALLLADTMGLLQRGRIVQIGPPLECLHHPATVEAARLVGQRNIFPAKIAAHDAARGRTLLEWRAERIEAAHQPHHAVGREVSWLIPASRVMLHRRDRTPSRGESENPVAGTIVDFVALGDTTISTVKLDGPETRTLALHVPRHVAERNRLARGERIGLSLLAEAIHIMPAPAMHRVERGSADSLTEARS